MLPVLEAWTLNHCIAREVLPTKIYLQNGICSLQLSLQLMYLFQTPGVFVSSLINGGISMTAKEEFPALLQETN